MARAMWAERLACIFSGFHLSEGNFGNQQSGGTKNHLLSVAELGLLLFLVFLVIYFLDQFLAYGYGTKLMHRLMM